MDKDYEEDFIVVDDTELLKYTKEELEEISNNYRNSKEFQENSKRFDKLLNNYRNSKQYQEYHKRFDEKWKIQDY